MQDQLSAPKAETIPQHIIDDLLTGVDKPARYVGGEVNSIVKDHPVRCRVALCFPDAYEVAESHIGLKILYGIINQVDDLAAERVYAFWPDLEQRARAAGVPLWSLETHRPLDSFDVVGFTLQYELSYPTLLAMLEHGGVTVRTAERAAAEPFVIGGGAGAFNPEPIAPFFDAFLLGDGEEAILEIVDAVAAGRARGASRADILLELARIDGVYVPSHFAIRHEVAGRPLAVSGIEAAAETPGSDVHSRHGTPRVTRRTLADLDEAPYPTATIIPNIKPVHDRVAIEIQRGCSQACRFCQAGMITRPTRQRSPEKVLALADASLAATGKDEVGLLSLSAGDYGPINHVLAEFFGRYRDDRISVSLPSMRTETMTPKLAAQVATVRKSGFTFAPEAGSERMRRVINKTNTEANLLDAVRATVNAGWRHLKFYFMIGLPTETLADVDAIASLAEKARAEGRRIRSDVDVTVSVSTFCPKPHTSFQWERQISVEETRAKQRRLRDRLKKSRIAFRYHSAEQSFLEGVLSRGDRRLASAIELAAARGCRFDAWTEQFEPAMWAEVFALALAPHGLTAADYLGERDEGELLPWDHLDAGILKKFLLRDRHEALAEGTIEDCAFSDHCYACGGCDLGDPYRPRPRQPDGSRPQAVLRPRIFGSSPGDAADPIASTAPGAVSEVPAAPALPDLTSRSRVRFRFAKVGRAFHMSHLDVKEHILRAIRLSRLPVQYTQGYSPRPRVGFSPACPTGIASEAEYFEADCVGFPDPATYADRLRRYLPDGLFITEAREVDWRGASLNDQISSMTFVVTPPDTLSPADLRSRVETFRVSPRRFVRVLRKKKARLMDAREQISEVVLVGDELLLTIDFAENGTIKISEAVAAIVGVESAFDVKIRKTAVDIAERAVRREREPVDEDGQDVLDLRDVSQRQVGPKTTDRRREGLTVPYAE